MTLDNQALPSMVFSMVLAVVGARKGVDFESMKYSTMPAPNSLATRRMLRTYETKAFSVSGLLVFAALPLRSTLDVD